MDATFGKAWQPSDTKINTRKEIEEEGRETNTRERVSQLVGTLSQSTTTVLALMKSVVVDWAQSTN